jgi:hypothetical protein
MEGFVVEHPVFCTVVALGVLVSGCPTLLHMQLTIVKVIVSPWVIEALGFAELGPVEGMCSC